MQSAQGAQAEPEQEKKKIFVNLQENGFCGICAGTVEKTRGWMVGPSSLLCPNHASQFIDYSLLAQEGFITQEAVDGAFARHISVHPKNYTRGDLLELLKAAPEPGELLKRKVRGI